MVEGFKKYRIVNEFIFNNWFWSFILFNLTQVIAQPLTSLQNKTFTEVNVLRKNPLAYYKKFKTLFDKNKNASSFFQLVNASSPLIWSEPLYQKAKSDVNSNYLSDDRYLKSFCGSAGFGASHDIEDSLVINFIVENYNTILSTDYQQIGIYSGIKKEVISGNNYSFKTSYAYIGTTCNTKVISYKYPSGKYKIDSSQVDFKKLNTGINCTYLSSIEKEMIKEINYARCYPVIYSKIIANWLIEEGNDLTFNDYIAGQEIVEELSKMKPLNRLLPEQKIFNSAKKHGQDLVKRGYSGHTGTDNSSPFDRIKKALGSAYLDGSENLVGGGSPRGSVISLLIDGGIGSRGHRYNIINSEWTHIGCYFVGKIGDMESNYVQNFAKVK
jgi:hypothetical protein